MDAAKEFRQKLAKLADRAKKQDMRLSVQQIREEMKDEGLDEQKLQYVYSYFDMMSVEVYDEDLQNADDDEDRELKSEGILGQYVAELSRLPAMDEVEELTLFHMAAEGHREAKQKLASRYLTAVFDLAGEIEQREKEEKKKRPGDPANTGFSGGFTREDLVQEGNMGLLLALEKMERQDSLAAYRALLLNSVTAYLEGVVEEEKKIRKSDTRVLNRMNQLAHAAHDLEEELDRKPSLEELSAYLDLPAEEIQDLLRMGGEKMNVDSL